MIFGLMNISRNKFTITVVVLAITFFAGIACKNKLIEEQQIFTYNESSDIATLDPAFAKNQSIMWAVHQLYNTLVEVDSNLQIVPSLAKKWEISNDKLTYTFYLRDSVFFHENDAFAYPTQRRLTAADVVYSYNRIVDKQVASSGAWIFNNRVAPNGFKAINDTVFQLTLLKPFFPILGILSTQYCSIVPREVVEKYGKDFRRNPCGSGPFKFKYWDEGQALVLHKNVKYWEKDKVGKQLPYLNAISIRFFGNKATEFLQFRQGKLSFMNDIDASFKDEVLTKAGQLRPKWNGLISLKKNSYLNVEYFGILMDSVLPQNKQLATNNLLVRQAINYAIDKRKLMMYMRNSIGIAAEAGFVPSGLPSNNTKVVQGYNYNPTKAIALLQQANYKPNLQNPIQIITIPIYADLASFVAKQLEEVGIIAMVDVVQKSVLLEKTSTASAPFFRGSWIADYPDAENYMAMFYSKNPAPPNYTRYKNAAFDKMYEQALQTTNDSLRYQLYQQLDQLVINDAPIVPLWYDEVIHFVQPNIKGFTPNALNLLELRRAYIE